MADGKVVFEIIGDNTKVKQSLTETTRAINNETKNWDQSVDDSGNNISGSLIGAFTKVVASAAFVKIGKMLLDLGIESINLASDLEEVQNVVDVTFGEKGAAEIEKWSKTAASNFGLTELQAKRYSSTIGAMMKSSGMAEEDITELSMSIAGLAADMASFYNLDFDEAFLKIQSGLSGETEPLKRLGINMSYDNLADFVVAQENFTKPFGKMTQAEQTLTRYQYLMQATADAQGDFVRTSDSYANSQRRITTAVDSLKAMLGEALLPIASEVSNAVADLLEMLVYQPPETAFDVASDAMNDAVESSTKAQGILGYMDKLYEKYGDMATNTDEWKRAMEELKAVFPEVNSLISEETGALTLSNEELKKYVENTKQAAIENAKKNAVQQLTNDYTQAGVDYYTQEIYRDIAQAQADEAVMGIINYIVAENQKRIQSFGPDWDSEGSTLTTTAEEWMQGFRNGTVSMKDLMYFAYESANNNGEGYDTLDRFKAIYEEQSKASSTASKEMENLQRKMADLEADLNIANAALERLASAAGEAAANITPKPEGSFASGLDYVPHDGFYALLHRGEGILTETENKVWQGIRNGGAGSGFDFDTLGSTISNNTRGGNVYLDGQIVGRIISDRQGDSYRALERSGWQQ